MMIVGLIQFAPIDDVQSNYVTVTKLAEQVASQGATLIVLPEMWTCEFNLSTVATHAEPIPGSSTLFLASLAKRLGIWIIGGSIAHSKGDQLLNTCPVLSSRGDLIGLYSKRFLFKITIPNVGCFNEGDVFTPETSRFSFSIGEFKIGVGICFDVRFPQLALDYLVHDHCNVLVFPSAFSASAGPLRWSVVGRARAIDTQCWVVMVSASLREESVFRAFGHSFVADPSGVELAALDWGEGCSIARLTTEALDVARQALPIVEYQTELHSSDQCVSPFNTRV
jgi:omega-amidase